VETEPFITVGKMLIFSCRVLSVKHLQAIIQHVPLDIHAEIFVVSAITKISTCLSLTHKICAFQMYIWSLQESDCLNERREIYKQLELFFYGVFSS